MAECKKQRFLSKMRSVLGDGSYNWAFKRVISASKWFVFNKRAWFSTDNDFARFSIDSTYSAFLFRESSADFRFLTLRSSSLEWVGELLLMWMVSSLSFFARLSRLCWARRIDPKSFVTDATFTRSWNPLHFLLSSGLSLSPSIRASEKFRQTHNARDVEKLPCILGKWNALIGRILSR